MIVKYDHLVKLLLNKKGKYSYLEDEVVPDYKIEDIIDIDVIENIFYGNRRMFLDYLNINEQSITLDFDTLEEIDDKFEEAIKVLAAIKVEFKDLYKYNFSLNIDNNFRLNKDNFKEILKVKEKLENEGVGFVFSEVIGSQENEWTLEEVLSSNEKIDKIVENIKEKNFSPLEKILYVYNFVANFKSYKSNENSKGAASRSIYAILNNDECVCLGYAQLLEAIINRLGDDCLKAYTNCLSMNNGGHANNFVYIKDEKYDVDGYYFFDSTGDNCSEKYSDMIEEKYKLIYFMLPLSALSKIEKNSYRASYKWAGKNIVSFDGDVFMDLYVETLKKGQTSYDEDIHLLNKDNAKEYFAKKSKPFDKSKFIELFTTTFPHLSVKECKKIFRNNELWCGEKFNWDSDEVIFYDSEFESEITENKKSNRRG